MNTLRSKHSFTFGSLALLAGSALWVGWVWNNHACTMRDDTPSIQYEDFSTNFHGQALWLASSDSGATNQFYCSAFRLNDWWAVTAAHCVTNISGRFVTNLSARTSANYNNPSEGEVRQIVKVIVHPGFTGGPATVGYNSVDVALLKFDAPLSGPSVSIGSVQVGQTITAVGYGLPGTPSAGFLPVDGKRRAYQMSAVSTTRTNYYRFRFWDFDGFLPLEGCAMPGDSGGGVMNSAGELVAIRNTGSPTSPRNPGENNALRLDLQKAWIEANIVSPLVMAMLPGTARLSWDSTATGYRLQASDALPTWTNLSSVITSPGTYDDPTTNHPYRFYRLIKP